MSDTAVRAGKSLLIRQGCDIWVQREWSSSGSNPFPENEKVLVSPPPPDTKSCSQCHSQCSHQQQSGSKPGGRRRRGGGGRRVPPCSPLRWHQSRATYEKGRGLIYAGAPKSHPRDTDWQVSIELLAKLLCMHTDGGNMWYKLFKTQRQGTNLTRWPFRVSAWISLRHVKEITRI